MYKTKTKRQLYDMQLSAFMGILAEGMKKYQFVILEATV